MYWRVGAEYRKRPAEENRSAFCRIVDDGPSPGLLALEADLAVGWCQVTPRAAIPAIEQMWRLQRVDDTPVWSISCLYVRKGYRKRGITAVLIAEAVAAARQAGAPAIEAYPFDASVSPSSTGTGYASTFARAGFTTVVRHVPARPIMRLTWRRRPDGG